LVFCTKKNLATLVVVAVVVQSVTRDEKSRQINVNLNWTQRVNKDSSYWLFYRGPILQKKLLFS
jgi:uncharacterized protein involved in tellurium resistance